MENKINLIELLKDCPSGMELDCALYDDVVFMAVDKESDTIILRVGDKFTRRLNKYGQDANIDYAKCVIFPKGKNSWEGFQRPFKEGDIYCIKTGNIENIFIFKSINEYNYIKRYVNLHCNSLLTDDSTVCHINDVKKIHFAAEEEKQKLFQAIKDNGYEWNAETKTLEKLVKPKFKVGDKIKGRDNCRSSIVTEIKDDCFIIKTLDGLGHSYLTDKLPFSKQNEYELVADKFNINTLKPFDRVLVRGNVGQRWTIDFFGFMDNNKGCPFVCVGHYVTQCIPYDGNEHLLGKTDDCAEFYKTWE